MAINQLNFTLNQVREIAFFKRDEITTDLICCEVSVSSDGREDTLFFHEEMDSWQRMIAQVSELPDFDQKWFETVMQPPFKEQRTVAYRRAN